MIKFKCLDGSAQTMVFEFEEECIVLGRGRECTVCLDDDACSRYHARITETPDGFIITDLQSTNGLRVNNQLVTQAALRYGDRFMLGRHSFFFLSKSTSKKKVESDPLIENTVTLDSVKLLCSQMGSSDFEELKRTHRMMQAAYRLSQAINVTLSVEDLYTLISGNIFENFKEVERVCFFLRRKEGTVLELVKNVSKNGGEEHPVSRSLLKQVEAQRVGILASDASSDDRFSGSESIVIMGLRSVMVVPMVARNRFLGAIYVENCHLPNCFKKVDLELLTLLGNQAAAAIENAFLYEDLQVSFYETVLSLSNALEAKDKYTRGHSARVARYAVGVGLEMGLPPEQVERLRTAAELHDIGKIAISESIISKPGKLTDEEFAEIKKHPQLGVIILKPIRFLEPMLPFILHHHERYDGSGYPDGLKGEDSPLEARILNLVDAFDAMTTQRSYNKVISFTEARVACNKGAGFTFDAECMRAFDAYLATIAGAPAGTPGDQQGSAPGPAPSGTRCATPAEVPEPCPVY